jgi:hypothetical protein
MRFLTDLKTFTIVAALLAGGTALAMAQNGLPTGGERLWLEAPMAAVLPTATATATSTATGINPSGTCMPNPHHRYRYRHY